jgi:hypothetical protein
VPEFSTAPCHAQRVEHRQRSPMWVCTSSFHFSDDFGRHSMTAGLSRVVAGHPLLRSHRHAFAADGTAEATRAQRSYAAGAHRPARRAAARAGQTRSPWRLDAAWRLEAPTARSPWAL